MAIDELNPTDLSGVMADADSIEAQLAEDIDDVAIMELDGDPLPEGSAYDADVLVDDPYAMAVIEVDDLAGDVMIIDDIIDIDGSDHLASVFDVDSDLDVDDNFDGFDDAGGIEFF